MAFQSTSPHTKCALKVCWTSTSDIKLQAHRSKGRGLSRLSAKLRLLRTKKTPKTAILDQITTEPTQKTAILDQLITEPIVSLQTEASPLSLFTRLFPENSTGQGALANVGVLCLSGLLRTSSFGILLVLPALLYLWGKVEEKYQENPSTHILKSYFGTFYLLCIIILTKLNGKYIQAEWLTSVFRAMGLLTLWKWDLNRQLKETPGYLSAFFRWWRKLASACLTFELASHTLAGVLGATSLVLGRRGIAENLTGRMLKASSWLSGGLCRAALFPFEDLAQATVERFFRLTEWTLRTQSLFLKNGIVFGHFYFWGWFLLIYFPYTIPENNEDESQTLWSRLVQWMTKPAPFKTETYRFMETFAGAPDEALEQEVERAASTAELLAAIGSTGGARKKEGKGEDDLEELMGEGQFVEWWRSRRLPGGGDPKAARLTKPWYERSSVVLEKVQDGEDSEEEDDDVDFPSMWTSTPPQSMPHNPRTQAWDVPLLPEDRSPEDLKAIILPNNTGKQVQVKLQPMMQDYDQQSTLLSADAKVEVKEMEEMVEAEESEYSKMQMGSRFTPKRLTLKRIESEVEKATKEVEVSEEESEKVTTPPPPGTRRVILSRRSDDEVLSLDDKIAKMRRQEKEMSASEQPLWRLLIDSESMLQAYYDGFNGNQNELKR